MNQKWITAWSFAIPHHSYTYIGTTDTPYDEEIDTPHATRQEVEYLIRSANSIFNANLNSDHVSSTWAGLRPLIYQEGKKFSELARKDEVFKAKADSSALPEVNLLVTEKWPSGSFRPSSVNLNRIRRKQCLSYMKVLDGSGQCKRIGI